MLSIKTNAKSIIRRGMWRYALILICCALTACQVGQSTRPGIDTELRWPPSPQPARIRFVTSLSSPVDLQIQSSVFKRLWNYMAGKATAALVRPHGIAMDRSGRLYVVDTYMKTVNVYDQKRQRHHNFDTRDAPLLSPIDLAIDDQHDRIYLTDSQAGVVRIFTQQGLTSAGELGRGVLRRPTGIALNTQSNEVLVVDTLGAQILRFDRQSLQLRGRFGGAGSGIRQFHYPIGIDTSPDGNIIVADSLNFRVQVLSATGQPITTFGRAGDRAGYFARPKGIAADSDGNIYVVDSLLDNVQMFDAAGRLLMAFGRRGRQPGEFWLPSAIFINQDDTIYVSDAYNKRVQVFQYLKADG